MDIERISVKMETFLGLPDDIIFHLFKYLSEKDCMALSLSGICDRLPLLYGERSKRIAIPQCYFVTQYSFQTYIKHWICQELITSCDLSHCYWLPADFLLNVICSLSQLNDLSIQDTQLNLSHVSKVFENCNHVTKIGFNLVEDNWDHFEMKLQTDSSKPFETLCNGLKKLTALTILAFNCTYYIDSWLVILQLLSYCRKCVNLHLEVYYSDEYFRYGPYGKDDYDDEIVTIARSQYFPRLNWMASLEKLVIVKKGCGMSTCYPDECVKKLVHWIFSMHDMDYLGRVWIQESDVQHVVSDHQLITSSVKSILLGGHLGFDLMHDRFRQLEHIGGIGFSELAALPNLRYIRGYCVSSDGVDEFCRAHPNLEHLHLNDNNGLPFQLKGDWMLNKLKTLVYCCSFPKKEILEKFVRACPNVESLHIGYSNRSALDPWTCPFTMDSDADLLNLIRFDRLTTLSLNAFDLFKGEFFEVVFSCCPQLRTLHLCGGFCCVECFENLCRFLPLARQLRDLRLQFADCDGEMMPHPALPVLDALLACPTLERLVLFEEEGLDVPWSDKKPEDILYQFAISMKHLIAFCFVSASPLESSAVAEIKQKFNDDIIPIRPAFWYHIDQFLPGINDPTVPRIHYDEIVCPINYFEVSPSL